MYRLFDAHSDLFEDVDEKRARGLDGIIRSFHAERWRTGGCAGGFCPIWVDPFCEVYTMPVEEQARRIIGHMNDEFAECGDYAVQVTDAASYEAAVREGKHAIFTGCEGLSFAGGDSGAVEALYGSGMREFSLTWNETNEFAGGAGGDPGAGLTTAGRECVRRIESLGAMLDLAHASRQTFYDAAGMLQTPFMVSHGNTFHYCSHPRNLTDDQLKVIAEFNGVFGISAYAPFLSENPAEWTVARLCDHIEYAADLMGIDCVGLGFDLVDFLDDFGVDESISTVVSGLESVAASQNIAVCLEQRGWKPEDIQKVFSGNYLRLIREVLG